MWKATAITCVFLDIGGVLLTDGWIVMPANERRRTPSWSWTRSRIGIT